VGIAAKLMHAGECWVTRPPPAINFLRKKNMEFALNMVVTRENAGTPAQYAKAKVAAKMINIPGLYIRRVMKWFGELMHTEVDLPSKEAMFNKKEWFVPWFFGLKWEEAFERAKDQTAWERHIDECIGKHALPSSYTNVEVESADND